MVLLEDLVKVQTTWALRPTAANHDHNNPKPLVSSSGRGGGAWCGPRPSAGGSEVPRFILHSARREEIDMSAARRLWSYPAGGG